MSSKSSESDNSEWTLITHDGQFQDEIDNQSEIADNEEEEEEEEENEINVESLRNIAESLDSTESGNDSSSSSDIEKIEELPSMQISPVPQLPQLSIAIKQDDTVGEETCESVKDDSECLLPAVENQKELTMESMRTYVHTPNERVNLSLNILMALALALVLGLGLGHFIGWSSQWIQRHHDQQRQVGKLKMLQDELTSCLSDKSGSSVACDRKLNYWKRQFEELLFENEDLQRIMDYGQSSECHDKQQMEAEKEKLKLSLFYKQLEHSETLKQFELVQQDERTHRQKLKTLEEDNENLKLQLEIESADDEKYLNFLMKENTKLRLSIESSEELDDDDSIIRVEMGSLREQINQLHSENEDLRQVIAKLRYGRPFESDLSVERQNEMNELQTENGELKIEIGKIRYSRDGEKINDLREKIEEMRMAIDEEKNQTKMWKKMYEESKAEYNVTKASWQLLNAMQTTTDEMLRAIESNGAKIVDVVQDVVNKSREDRWSEKVWNGINNSTQFLSERLVEKWAEMQKLVSQHERTGHAVVQTVNQLLTKTADTVSNAVRAVNLTQTQQQAEKIMTNIMDKFWDVVDDLNRRWDEDRDKKKSEKTDTKKKSWQYNQENKKSQMNLKNIKTHKEKQKKQTVRTDWVFDRARDREKQRRIELNRRTNKMRINDEENWYLKKMKFSVADKNKKKLHTQCNKLKKGCETKDNWPSWTPNVDIESENCCGDRGQLPRTGRKPLVHCGC